MGKFLIDVFFTTFTFCFFVSLAFSFLKKNQSLTNRIASWSILFVGVFLGVYIHILRIKNKKEMVHTVAKLNRYVLAFSLLAFILTLIILIMRYFFRKKTSLYKILSTISVIFLFVIVDCMLYLIIPRLLTQTMEFIAFGEDSVSTLTLFRVSGFALGILVSFLLILSLYKFLIRCSDKLYSVTFVLIYFNLFFEYFIRGISAIVRLKQYLKKDFGIDPILTEKSYVFGVKTFDIMIFEAVSDMYFIIGLFLILIICSGVYLYSNRKVLGNFENKAKLRKEKWRLIVNKRWSYSSIFFATIVVFSVTYINYQITKPVELTAAQPYQEEGNNIIIPLSEVDDGHLHRFSYKKDGHDIRFIIVKKPNSTAYGVGLDACQICGVAGYYERKNDVVCKRCDVVMNKATIGFKGGCNPIPFEYKIENSKIIIEKSVLDKEKERFPIGE